MSDHQHGAGLLPSQTLEQFNDFPASAAVECSGWFIGKQKLGPGRQSTGNGNTLLLPTRKILGKLAEVILEADSPQPLTSLITTTSVTETRKQISTHLHVLFSGETAQKVVPLKNHADPATKLLALPTPCTLELLPENAHISLLNLTKRTDQSQESGLATARGAGEQHHFTGSDLKINRLKNLAAC
jgi:hypothetical protein